MKFIQLLQQEKIIIKLLLGQNGIQQIAHNGDNGVLFVGIKLVALW